MVTEQKIKALVEVLRRDDYPVEKTAKTLLSGLTGAEAGVMLTLVVGLGHLDLADALLRMGVRALSTGHPWGSGWKAHQFFRVAYEDNDALTIAAEFWNDFYGAPPSIGKRRHARQDMVAFLQERAPLFGDVLARKDEALLRSMQPGGEKVRDCNELTGFQNALVAAGANPNWTDTCLPNLLTSAHILDGLQGGGTVHLDAVLSWKPDLALLAPATYARAISKEGRTGSWGAEAKRLQSRGVPLCSPQGGMSHMHPLLSALSVGCRPAILAMVEAGVDTSWRSDGSQDTLLTAVCGARMGTKALVKSLDLLPDEVVRALVNQPDAKGYSPLHKATQAMSLPMVEWLLSRGANPNAVNQEGKTPLELMSTRSSAASMRVMPAIIQALVAHGAATPQEKGKASALHQAASMLDAALCKDLLAKGALADAKGPYNKTPMALALRTCLSGGSNDPRKRWDREAKLVEVAEVLLDAGADIEQVVGAHKRRMLHMASLQVLPALCEMLLTRGAEVDVLDGKGRSPLNPGDEEHRRFMAEGIPQEKKVEAAMAMVAAFRNAGVGLMGPDAAGMTPFSALRSEGALGAILAQEELEVVVAETVASGGRRPRM